MAKGYYVDCNGRIREVKSLDHIIDEKYVEVVNPDGCVDGEYCFYKDLDELNRILAIETFAA